MTRFRKGILLLTGILLVCSAVLSVRQIASSHVPVVGSSTALPVILIDPGHGGQDGGAVGVDGLVEKEINLEISLTLRDLFLINGFEVVMTREEDRSIHDEGVTGTRNQKTSDLRNRLAMTSQYPNVILLSIHQNKFGSASSRGFQVFYGPNHAGSKTLAELTQKNAVEMLQPENHRLCKQGEKNLFLIHEAKCPALLVECGFLSNAAEAALLTDEAYQAQLGFVIVRSVMEYLGLDSAVLSPR